MRKLIKNLERAIIVKIVLAVCLVGSASALSIEHALIDFYAKKLSENSGSSLDQAKSFVSTGPLGGFVTNNPAVATQMATLLNSNDPNKVAVVENFISQIKVNNVENAANALNSIGITDAAAKSKYKEYLSGIQNTPNKAEETFNQLATSLKSGLPAKQVSGTTGGQQSGATAGATAGTTGGEQAGSTAGKPPETPEQKLVREKKEREEAELRQREAQLQDLALRNAQQQAAAQNGGGGRGAGGGGGGGGGGKGGGAGGAGNPPNFGNSQNNSDVGNQVSKHTQDQKSKESENPRNLLGNNNSFGNNNSSGSDQKKDPFKKDDKDGGFKLPEPKTDKNATKNVSKPGTGKTDPLADPSGDAAQGPGVGYNSNLALVGPTKVPGLAPVPDYGAMLAAAAGGGGGGSGGGDGLSGANIKSGGGGGGASFEGNPFNSNEGMMGGGGMGGPAFRKISPEAGAGGDGESVEAAGGGSSNDFKKKGTIMDQILTFGPSDEERLKNLGIMAYVARRERICTIPGRPLLDNCPSKTKNRRIITREDDE